MKTPKDLFYLILATAVISVAACNSSSSSSAPDPEVAALKTQVQDLSQALAAATHEDAQKLSEFKLIGIPEGTTDVAGRILNAVGNVVSFGPCADMGVMIGFENSSNQPANALNAVSEDFKQCTGYIYGANVSDGTVTTGQRIFWDGPNCTGNLLEWEAAGGGYSTTALQGGVVFTSPVDNLVYMVRAGQTPQPVLIQSAWVLSNPGCQSDVETQLMYTVEPNDISVTGVPSNGVGKFHLGAP